MAVASGSVSRSSKSHCRIIALGPGDVCHEEVFQCVLNWLQTVTDKSMLATIGATENPFPWFQWLLRAVPICQKSVRWIIHWGIPVTCTNNLATSSSYQKVILWSFVIIPVMAASKNGWITFLAMIVETTSKNLSPSMHVVIVVQILNAVRTEMIQRFQMTTHKCSHLILLQHPKVDQLARMCGLEIMFLFIYLSQRLN